MFTDLGPKRSAEDDATPAQKTRVVCKAAADQGSDAVQQIMARQVCKISRQVEMLKNVCFDRYILMKEYTMVDIMSTVVKDYQKEFAKFEREDFVGKQKMGTLVAQAFIGVVKFFEGYFTKFNDNENAQVAVRLTKYFLKLDIEKIGRFQVKCFKLAKAWARNKIKLEVAIVPNSQICILWYQYFEKEFVSWGGRLGQGPAPKGDLERELQGVFGFDGRHMILHMMALLVFDFHDDELNNTERAEKNVCTNFVKTMYAEIMQHVRKFHETTARTFHETLHATCMKKELHANAMNNCTHSS